MLPPLPAPVFDPAVGCYVVDLPNLSPAEIAALEAAGATSPIGGVSRDALTGRVAEIVARHPRGSRVLFLRASDGATTLRVRAEDADPCLTSK